MAAKPSDRKSKNFLIDESLRIAVQKQIQSFIADDGMQTLEFPVSFTNTQRGFVHKYVQAKGLTSKSHGKGVNRRLTIYKPNSNTFISYDATLELTDESESSINKFLQQNPVTDREMTQTQELGKNKIPKKYYYSFAIFKLSIPPTISISNDIVETHVKLPITNYRQVIVDMINKNRVVVISGDTGSGKTTQVPQYILEDCCLKNEPCRVICTQPRRIAAVSMADRVAYERNEDVGNAVGYQIRLESKISPASNLIYTTSGFLLRCLISDTAASWLSRITHIIMDEVHERDKYTDFLFIALKEALISNPKLKVILMSATIDTTIFTAYFNCPLMTIPGRMHPVEINQLEDVLGMIGYSNKQIQNEHFPKQNDRSIQVHKDTVAKPSNEAAHSSLLMDDDRNEIIDHTLQECFYGRSDFDQFFYLVTGERVDVNVRHSETDLNALMIAAINGLPDVIETLLKMKADPTIVGGFGFTAKEWADKYDQKECVELLERAERIDTQIMAKDEKIKDNQKRLQLYLDQTNETEIDHVLLFNTIKFIHEKMPEGSILVFLPGYDAIVEQMNALMEGSIGSNIEVLVLHGNMETSDQKKAFAKASFGSRKIILSTNIAETSLTIDDVVYVIDCGKVKQISYDSLSESTSLTSTWISKACAKQRLGRAGRTRPGICYRLYSKQRFDAMEEFTLPELLRIPLTELCLHARIMTKTSISDYLSKALQPPPTSTVNQSIKLLKTVGALNDNEDVTELGYRLVDLPVDVQLGKMLLYSIMMRCLDPVLTIVSALSVKDPFVLNFENENQATFTRRALADNSCSDLMVFIKLFQRWLENKAKGRDYQFCRENNVSNGIMELINGFRSQILGQLRTIGFISPRGNGDMADVNWNSHKFAVVKACFVAGFYPNVCRVDRKVGNLKSKQEKKVLPHITSVLREKNLKSLKSNLINLPSEWIVFEEKSRVERLCLVRNNTVVTPITIALFGGPIHIPNTNLIAIDDSDSEDDELPSMKFVLDDWIYFVLDDEPAVMIHQLRIKLNALFIKTMCNIDKKCSPVSNECKIIEVISNVLEVEDRLAGFASPKDVGLRPISLPTENNLRNNNKMQRNNDGGNYQNGKSKLHHAQQSQQLQQFHHQQRQSASNQLANTLNTSNGIPQRSIIYRRNKTGSRVLSSVNVTRSNTNGISNDFDRYVAYFKCQIMLKPRVRWFVLHARSKAGIEESYLCHQKWYYSMPSLRNFKSIMNTTKEDILVFFLIPKSCFFTMGRLYQTGNYVNIECLVAKEVSINEARNIKLTNFNQRVKTLDELDNGEEILNPNVAEQFLLLFLREAYVQ